MLFRIAADALLVLHMAFILFVVAGGLLVFVQRRWAWLHLPLAAWGALVELASLPCPLTPLENRLRVLGGEQGYGGGFIEHYLLPVIYPPGLAVSTQLVLGLLVIGINAGVYGLWWWRYRR